MACHPKLVRRRDVPTSARSATVGILRRSHERRMVDLRVHSIDSARTIGSGKICDERVGRVAQLGERCVRNAEVASSILAASTILRS